MIDIDQTNYDSIQLYDLFSKIKSNDKVKSKKKDGSKIKDFNETEERAEFRKELLEKLKKIQKY